MAYILSKPRDEHEPASFCQQASSWQFEFPSVSQPNVEASSL
jgi:hypothetical protein